MDYLDFAKAGENGKSTLTRLAIVSTVTMALALAASMRGIKRVQDYPYPLTIVAFAAANGLIFRAISWSELNEWNDQRSTLLTSFDYPRMLFFTISNLTVHLIPIVTLHRWLARKNRSLSDDGLPGVVSMISYFFTFVIFALVICLMGIGSTIPWNQDIMNAIIYDNTDATNLGLLPAFLNLMDASNMIYWWFTLSYVIILVKHYVDFHWTFLAFCILLIVTQIVLTISSFLPQINSVPSGIMIGAILQFIFVFQFSFICLMIAIFKGSTWVPPPVHHFEEEEMQGVNNH